MSTPLQGQADRIKYLQTKQAKIVAMTCTHAALKRREFLDIGFKYDNLLMEESAQILEIESFIPMLLQVFFLWSSSPRCPAFTAL
jgi:intron-binding protein aquarius